MLIAIVFTTLKAVHEWKAGHDPFSKGTIELLIFGALTLLCMGLIIVAPTILAWTLLVAKFPTLDRPVKLLVGLAALIGTLFLAFESVMNFDGTFVPWIYAMTCALLPRLVVSRLRPGRLVADASPSAV